jgi:hypothetical protein
MAITSKEINLTQLTNELNGIGLIANFEDKAKKVISVADGYELTEAALKAAIDSHVAISELQIEADKATAKAALLEKLGITADEAKLLLA